MSTPLAQDTFTIRPAAAEDLSAVIALLLAAKLAPNAIDEQFGAQFAVAVDSRTGRVIGAAGVERYGAGTELVGLLRSAVVDSGWRGRGVGAALTDDRLRYARAEAMHSLYLLTETAADYWPRFGFEQTPRDGAPAVLMASHEWRSGCPASAIAMRLPLPRVV
jgi:amino-acid N-acetyltransferase